ncbi:MAG: hypothetical protein D6744_17030, partial [Planctomycetota bacterium]
MPVLIDGNNLLFAAQQHGPEPPIGRTQLCEIVGNWSRRTGERVHVVFDGPEPSPQRAEQVADPDIDVSYSRDVSADEVLIELINRDSAARRLRVVSSDREIAAAAKRRRATPVRSDEFWFEMCRLLARPPRKPLHPAEKYEGAMSDEDVDAWMK